MAENNDNSLQDELSSLLNDLKNEKKEDTAESQKTAAQPALSKTVVEIQPYNLKKINKLKPGGKLFLKRQNIIGVDIGSSSIKLVQIDATRKPPLIYGYAYEEIPFDLREKGKKFDEYISENLKQLIKKKQLYDSIAVSYLSGAGVYVYSGTIDKVPENEIPAAIKTVLEEKAAFDLNEAVLQYNVTGESSGRTGEKLELTAVAAKKDVVKNMAWLIEESGLQINGLSTPAYAFENVFALKKDSIQPNIVVINFGAKRTEINYYRDGKFVANREISVAGNDLNKTLNTKLNIDENVIQLDMPKAESVKRNMGVVINPAETKDDPVISRCSSLTRPVLEKMAAEIKRSLAYFQKTANVQKMDKIYIVGGGANMKHLSLYFKNEIASDVELFPMQKYFKIAPELLQDEDENEALNTIVPACGLIFEGTSSVNLVPAATRGFSMIASYKHAWNLIVGSMLFCMTVLFAYYLYDKKEIEKQLYASEDSLQQLDQQAKQIESFRAFKQQVIRKKELVENLLSSGPHWNGLLAELSRITPSCVIFQSMEVEITPEGGLLHILGNVDTNKARLDQSLSELIKKMEASPFFNGVELIRMEENPKSKNKMAQFEVKGWLLF